MDRLIQGSTIATMVAANILVFARTQRLVNPVSIICTAFFVPLVFALSRLSGLQSSSWGEDTYLLIWESLVAWLLLPTVAILVIPIKKASHRALGGPEPLSARSADVVLLSRAFALLVGSSYIIANYLQAGRLLPVLDPIVAFFLHTDFPQGLRILVRMTPAVVGMSFMAFYLRRKRIDLLLMLFALMLPLTRLSRIDVFMSLVVVIVLSSYFPIITLNRKRLLGLLAALVLFVGGLSYLGNLRLTWYGRYDLTFARAIDFRGNAGPADIFAYLYLAFPLSFENLDRFVAQHAGPGSLGLGSFDWIFSGLLKLNLIIPGYVDIVAWDFDPVSTGANVPTALAVFFLDFGVVGAWLPMLTYLVLWLWLFWRANESPLFAVFYALMSAAFALSSFQAIMTRAVLYYQLLAVLVVFFLNRQTRRTPLSSRHADTSQAGRVVES